MFVSYNTENAPLHCEFHIHLFDVYGLYIFSSPDQFSEFYNLSALL